MHPARSLSIFIILMILKKKPFCARSVIRGFMFALCILVFSACRNLPGIGVKKDLNTDLTTTYRSMLPAETILVMNGEVIRHTDIPLGESVTIINQNVTGLTIKNGQFSAGCALQISDEKGRPLFNQPDLFAGKDVFDAEKNITLKCTINTGSPMQWNGVYTATVKFWDKYGKGELVNEVKLRMTDYP